MTLIDDDRLDRLVALARSLASRTDAPDAGLRPTAEALLYREARLLDEQRYEQWVATFSDDGIYWVPINPDTGDPRNEVSLACDDRRRLEDRIARLATGWAHSQNPRSRTVRQVTNVEAWRVSGAEDDFDVRSNLVVHEFRRGHCQMFAGRQEHSFVRVDGELRLASRIVHLIDADYAVGNISFVV